MGDFLEVLNLNWLFLKFNCFIYNYVAVTSKKE